MANGLTTGIQEELLDHLLINSSYTSPTTVYAALFNGDPVGAGTEVSAGDYSRTAITFAAASTSSNTTTSSNSADVDFGTTTSAWGTVDYVAIYDASTAGTMLAAGALTASRTIGSGDPVKFATGELDVTLTRTT